MMFVVRCMMWYAYEGFQGFRVSEFQRFKVPKVQGSGFRVKSCKWITLNITWQPVLIRSIVITRVWNS